MYVCIYELEQNQLEIIITIIIKKKKKKKKKQQMVNIAIRRAKFCLSKSTESIKLTFEYRASAHNKLILVCVSAIRNEKRKTTNSIKTIQFWP